MRLSAFVTSFAIFRSYSSWSYSRSKSSLTFMMSGSVHPLSVKYSILRSTSESGMFSHCCFLDNLGNEELFGFPSTVECVADFTPVPVDGARKWLALHPDYRNNDYHLASAIPVTRGRR